VVGAAFAEAAIAAGRPVGVVAVAGDGAAKPVDGPDATMDGLRAIADAIGRCAGALGDMLVAGAVPGRLLVLARDRTPAEMAALGERIRLAVERARVPAGDAGD